MQWVIVAAIALGACGEAVTPPTNQNEPPPTVRKLAAGMYPIDSVEGRRRDTLDFSPGRDWYDGWVVSEGSYDGCDRAYQPTTMTLITTVSDVAVWGDSLELFLFKATGTCFRDGHAVIGSTNASRLKAVTRPTARSDSLSTTGGLSGVVLPSARQDFVVILGEWRLWFSRRCEKPSGCSVPWR